MAMTTFGSRDSENTTTFGNRPSSDGSTFGSQYGTKKTGKSDVDIVDVMDAYLPLLQASEAKKYIKTREEKDKPSWWQKTISFLSTGETGQAVYDMLDGKNPVASYGKSIADSISGKGYNKKTYADVLEKLGMKRGALSEVMPWLYNETGKGIQFKKGGFVDPTARGTLGLALDILGDPTTYLGGAGLFKRGGLNSIKGLSKEGKALRKTVLESTDDLLSKEADDFAKIAIQEKAFSNFADTIKSDPDKYFSGLTFMGKEILPRKAALFPGRIIDKTMSHIPIVNAGYSFAKNGIQDIFVYGADTLRKGKALGAIGEQKVDKLIEMRKMANRESQYAVDNLYKNLAGVHKDFTNAVSKGEREAANQYIRNGIEKSFKTFGITADKLDNTTVDNVARILDKYNKNFLTATNVSREGLDKELMTEMSGYLQHVMTPEARKAKFAKDLGKSLMRNPELSTPG